MKNLREHFKQMAEMQEHTEDADRMFAALVVGANAAIVRVKARGSYVGIVDIEAVEKELDAEEVTTTLEPEARQPATIVSNSTIDVDDVAQPGPTRCVLDAAALHS